MPIRPENVAKYPPDWKEISARIKVRAGNRCECEGECELHHGRRCQEAHGSLAMWANGKVILTTAHLDHDPSNCADENLKVMCQRCHLRYDRKHHAETAAITRDAKRGQLRLEIQP